MAHRRVKDISYDQEDDYYDENDAYDEESQGLSAGDQEHMRTGTIAVRAGLGPDSDMTTDTEIQDALYYYYFDTDKSIAYLKKQKRPEESQQTPKKQKTPSKFDQAAQRADGVDSGGR